MLGKRIATALIGIPVSVLIIHYGQWLFAIAVTMLALLSWQEFSNMLGKSQILVWRKLGFLAIISLLVCSWLGNTQEILFIFFFFSLIILLKPVFSKDTSIMQNVAFSVLGLSYIGLGFSYLILLRFIDNQTLITTFLGRLSTGETYLWLAFVGTWASDTFAYFTGSLIGKHKLCPEISPGKTVEGSLGGLLGSIAVVLGIGMVISITPQHAFALGALVGIAAPAGDLVESALKRFTGVKDSGALLPGHGGVLDRFDSILFTVPVVYYYVNGFMSQ